MLNNWENHGSRLFISEETVHTGKRETLNRIVLHMKNLRCKCLDVNFLENVTTEFDLICNECGCICLSRGRPKKSSKISHTEKSFTTHYVIFLLTESIKKVH